VVQEVLGSARAKTVPNWDFGASPIDPKRHSEASTDLNLAVRDLYERAGFSTGGTAKLCKSGV